jgi:hypothetical protein
MKKHMRMVFAAIGLTLAMTACERGRMEADKRAAEAEKKAQEATLTAGKMKADAEETAKLKAAHADTRSKLHKDLEAHERKATYLKEKAAKTTGVTKKNADAAIAELKTRETAAKTSLDKLGDDAAPAWDDMEKKAEGDVAAVGKSVDALEHTLMKK